MTVERDRSVSGLLLVLAALFFLSGAAALIYQVLWLRLLGLVFGVTVYAASTVWAAFMGGLAIGSILGGRLADRAARPLRWLAAVELLIGVTALATPLALDALQRAYAAVHPSLDSSLVSLTLMRLVISSAVLLVPAALMGATLPLVIRSSLLDARGLGNRAGVLYATNTAGAIAGTLAAGLVLIPDFGIRTSFLVAAGLNAIVALVAVSLGNRVRPAGGRAGAGVAGAAGRSIPADARQLVVLAVFTASGFISLALEVVWFRILTLFLRPTVYGYAMMLAAVLAGIAVGSSIAAPFLRRGAARRDLLMPLAWLEGGIAVAALLSFAVLPAIPWIMTTAGPVVEPLVGGYLAYQALVSASVILPAMLLFGAAFPIGLHVWASRGSDPDDVASRVGLFYALNVGGAIAGSLGAGFLLLPGLGSLKTLQLLAALALLSALALLAAARSAPPVRLAAAALLVMGCAGAWQVTPDPFEAFLAQRYPGAAIVWQREAVQATVSVHQEPRGIYTLHVSGNHQASSVGATHHRIGNLPMAVHPDPRRALVIGLGGGATAGAVAGHPGVEVDVVELSREVTQAAGRFFRDVNFGLLTRPNVRLHVDDGRNYLLLSGRRYDVVTADVILPIHAGSGNLYSREYFGLVRQALEPGGLVLQWVAGTEAEYQLIMRTFLSVFPETTLWADGSLMLGSVGPLQLRRLRGQARRSGPARDDRVARRAQLRGSAQPLPRGARRAARVRRRRADPHRRSSDGRVLSLAAAGSAGGPVPRARRRHAPPGVSVPGSSELGGIAGV